jgi:hypothetical protein
MFDIGFALNFLDINLKAERPISRGGYLFLKGEAVEIKLCTVMVTVGLIPLKCKA